MHESAVFLQHLYDCHKCTQLDLVDTDSTWLILTFKRRAREGPGRSRDSWRAVCREEHSREGEAGSGFEAMMVDRVSCTEVPQPVSANIEVSKMNH